MASNPPQACCYKGVKHEGEATGEISKLGDFEIYTKYPEDKSTDLGILMYVQHSRASICCCKVSAFLLTSHCICRDFLGNMVFLQTHSITDVIGHRFINAQLIADQFAANGYFVLMPDLFYGDPIPLNRPGDFDIQAWLKGEYNETKTSHLPPVVDPIIDSCLVEMRTKYKVKVRLERKQSRRQHHLECRVLVRKRRDKQQQR